MSTCPKCNIEFDDQAAFCSQCGGKLEESAAKGVSAHAEEDAHRLIAEANLLRLRREWDDAVQKCMQALQIAPQNAEAHSLLGRLYEDRGEVDEAVRWFQMAVDIEPANRSDRKTLDALLVRQARLRAAEAAAAGSGSESCYDRLWQSRRFRSFLGYAILVFFVAALAFVFFSLVKLVWLSPSSEMRTATQPPAPSGGQSPQPTPGGQLAVPPTPQTPVESSAQVRPLAEQQLLAQVRLYGALTQRGIIVEDIVLDPRKRSATVTFRLKEANPSRNKVLADAAVLSTVLFTARPEINDATVRAIASLPDEFGSQQWTLAFIGETTRSRATSVDVAAAPPDKIAGIFTSTYFHGRVK